LSDTIVVRRPGLIRNKAEGYAAQAHRTQLTDAAIPWSPVLPLSPTNIIVHRAQKERPNVAIVHSSPFRGCMEGAPDNNSSSPGLLRPLTSTTTQSAARLVLDANPIRSGGVGLARCTSLPDGVSTMERSSSLGNDLDHSQGWRPQSAQPSGSIRVLQHWEVRARNRKQVEYFMEAKAINRMARPIQNTEHILAKARQRRSNLDSARRNVVKDSKPIAKAETNSKGAERPVAPRKTLAEQFGYGLKTMEVPVATLVVPEKKKTRVGVQAGNNTLLERLSKRGANAESQ